MRKLDQGNCPFFCISLIVLFVLELLHFTKSLIFIIGFSPIHKFLIFLLAFSEYFSLFSLNFSTFNCRNLPGKCYLSKSKFLCRPSETKFYFDQEEQQCKAYEECGGHLLFDTFEECYLSCMSTPKDQTNGQRTYYKRTKPG